jgi:putative hydrolase of the HAD superfamily
VDRTTSDDSRGRLRGRPRDFGRKERACLQMQNRTMIVYWLVPAEPARELLREIIGILAKQFDAPRFEPHLTVFATAGAGKSPRRVLKRISARPIRLSVRGIGVSSEFKKTLFVRLASSRAFEKLVIDLARATKSRAKRVQDPHVSLLYKELPAPVKRELALTIKLPFRGIAFDSIKAIRSVSPIKARPDVEAWRVLARKSLSG